MISIKVNNKTYILGDHILEKAPIYSKGARGSRDLIKKKKINETDYIFARLNGNEWTITDGKSAKFDKVFFLKKFIKGIPELNEQDEKIIDDNGVEKAPNIIHLQDHEKFQDDEGNILDIETRGERHPDKIYFKVKDVASGFDIKYLNDSLNDKDGKYEYNIDYVNFICKKEGKSRQQTGKKIDIKPLINKELFLTFQGMLRVLFVSKNNKTSRFISWATKTLFTAQMGTTEQKNELVAQIKGVSYDSIQELFSINARTLPCVYLTAFNTVDKLRKPMNINDTHKDDSVVYKFGLTKSFEQRKNGHKSEYKKLDKHIDMKLVYYTYIDPLYISEAENEIKNLLSDYKIEYDSRDELVIIPNNMLKIVKTIYENIGMKYSGHTAEFNKKINELNQEINQLQNNEKLFNKELSNIKELHQKEKEIYEQKLKCYEMEIVNLKQQIKIMELEKLIKK